MNFLFLQYDSTDCFMPRLQVKLEVGSKLSHILSIGFVRSPEIDTSNVTENRLINPLTLLNVAKYPILQVITIPFLQT